MFVGLALGTAENDRALFIAIIFHQFFEGLGLGSRVAVANLKRFLSILAIDVIFAASAPMGIGIGIGIKSAIQNNTDVYDIVDGTVQVLSLSLLHSSRSEPLVSLCWHSKGTFGRYSDLRGLGPHDPGLCRS